MIAHQTYMADDVPGNPSGMISLKPAHKLPGSYTPPDHHVPRRKQQLHNHYWSVHRTYPCWASACWHGALRMAVLEAASTDCVAAARNNANVAAASIGLTEQQQ